MDITGQTVDQDQGQKNQAAQTSLQSIVIRGYACDRKLGMGTYGEVWLAREQGTNAQVAIKLFHHRAGQQWGNLQNEVRTLADLRADAGIIRLICVEAGGDRPYYVMDYAEGGSLADKLKQGPLPLNEAIKMFRQITEAMAYVHAKDIAHCDLKPANVLLDGRGRVRVADFGQAQMASGSPGGHSSFLGTYFYMAPEQASVGQRAPDPRWDVYALGALLHTMLTGRPPREDESFRKDLSGSSELSQALDAYRLRIRQAPAPVRHRDVRGIDRRLIAIIDRCLDLDPGRRFPNAQSVLDALDHRDRYRRLRPLVFLGFTLPLVLLAAMGVLAHWNARSAVAQSTDVVTRVLLKENELAARFVADKIEDQLLSLAGNLEKVARSKEFQLTLQDGKLEKLTEALQKLDEEMKSEVIWRWNVVDARGVTLANFCSKDPEAVAHVIDGKTLPLGVETNTLGRRWAWRDWFNGTGDKYTNRMVEGTNRLEPRIESDFPMITKRNFSQPFVGRGKNPGPFIAISVPVPAPKAGGGISGLLMVSVKMDVFDQVVRKILDLSGAVPVVVNQRGHLVLHPDPRQPGHLLHPPPEGNPQSYDSEIYRMAREKQSGSEEAVDPVDDGLYLCGYASATNLGWGVVVQQDRSTAVEPIHSLEANFIRRAWWTLAIGAVVMSGLWGGATWAIRKGSL